MSHILIALTAVLAFGLNYLALRGRDATVLVAVAAEAIAEGSELTGDHVPVGPCTGRLRCLSGLVTDVELESLEGRVASRSFEEGALLDESALIAGGVEDGLRTMSIPLAVEHAVGARIVVGDRVDVITVSDGVARIRRVGLARGLSRRAGGLGAGVFRLSRHCRGGC